jgi:hypothetical protein
MDEEARKQLLDFLYEVRKDKAVTKRLMSKGNQSARITHVLFAPLRLREWWAMMRLVGGAPPYPDSMEGRPRNEHVLLYQEWSENPSDPPVVIPPTLLEQLWNEPDVLAAIEVAETWCLRRLAEVDSSGQYHECDSVRQAGELLDWLNERLVGGCLPQCYAGGFQERVTSLVDTAIVEPFKGTIAEGWDGLRDATGWTAEEIAGREPHASEMVISWSDGRAFLAEGPDDIRRLPMRYDPALLGNAPRLEKLLSALRLMGAARSNPPADAKTETDAAEPAESNAGSTAANLPEWATLPEILDSLGLREKEAAIGKRFERWRKTHDGDFREVQNPRRNEPRFVYRVAAIMSLLGDLLSD